MAARFVTLSVMTKHAVMTKRAATWLMALLIYASCDRSSLFQNVLLYHLQSSLVIYLSLDISIIICHRKTAVTQIFKMLHSCTNHHNCFKLKKKIQKDQDFGSREMLTIL